MNPGLQWFIDSFIDSLIHPRHHSKDLPFWENSKQFPIILQMKGRAGERQGFCSLF
jgi:hypothetical protein